VLLAFYNLKIIENNRKTKYSGDVSFPGIPPKGLDPPKLFEKLTIPGRPLIGL
jgi:hypothetical protein